METAKLSGNGMIWGRCESRLDTVLERFERRHLLCPDHDILDEEQR